MAAPWDKNVVRPRPMRVSHRLAACSVAAALFLASAAPARAFIVERVVAVIGDRPILLSELRRRARPFLIQVTQRVPPGPQYAAAESQVLKEMMAKMIDEELESQAATKADIKVTPDEVDNAIRNVAQLQGLTPTELLRETAVRSGMTEQDFRDEIRRQILEGKMLQIRVRGRVRITEEDVKAMYERALREDRRRREYHPAWIVLRLLPGSTREAIAERRELANQLVQRARQGEDFASLAKSYSDDGGTREQGGDLGIRAPQGTQAATAGKRPMLAPELETVVVGLEPGQVADPVEAGGALVILKLVSRQESRYRSYEAAKPEMVQRLQAEILDKAKRKWLEELKSRTHLDVRL
jgi:peptidyl-prolyl cis-trans isomerase SurA